MERMLRLFMGAVLFCLSLFGIARAQTTYEDPQGRFAIDLPKGWQLAPQTDDKVFVFQGESKSIIIECVPGVNDPAELFKKGETTIRLSGMAKPALDGEVAEMTVNGLPARWGVFRGAMSGVTLAALCGGIAIGENGLYFVSFIAVNDVNVWKGRLEGVFQTIRASGAKVTGVEGVKTVAGAATPSGTAGESTAWKSDLVSLTLPPGWGEKPKPRGLEKEVKGWFMYDPLPGVSMMVVCYKGAGMTLAKALDAGMKSMTIPNPGMKAIEAKEIPLPSGKANYLALKGMVASGGAEVELASVVISIKADKSYTNLIVTGMGQLLPQLKEQAVEIAKTVK